MTTDPHPPTHDWHVGTDGMELLIRRDEADTVGVHLGHENIDDAHATVIITSRLLEMIDAVQPGAVRTYLAEQEPTEAELDAALLTFLAAENLNIIPGISRERAEEYAREEMGCGVERVREALRAALSTARAARRDKEKR